MKSGIHPTYHSKVKVTCACGAAFEVGSTCESYHVDVCSQCHPFYTGKQKLVDTEGRVDKFRARMEAAKKMQAVEEARMSKKTKKESVEEKIMRKVQEKEDMKEAEKTAKEEAKKEAAKKKAEKIIVKSPKEKAEKKPVQKPATKKSAVKKTAKKK